MRKISVFLAAAFLAVSASLSADVVTLPAAASIVGGNPFFSDVRVFNTSYDSSILVTATYRCFIASTGVPCPDLAPRIQIPLAPRESKAFNDIVAVAFGAPNTAGGVEFEFPGPEDQVVVTSRLYSSSPLNSVGMFIPGLDESRAHSITTLTSIRHDPLADLPNGFRTNVGVFNPGDVAVDVTFTIFDGNARAGNAVVRSIPLHSGLQVSGIFEAAGLPDLSTENATIVVSAEGPVFSYAAVLDNRTADPIFVVGAPDQSAEPATPTTTPSGPTVTRTQTPPGGMTATATRTPTAGGPTPTRTATATLTPPGPTATPTLTMTSSGVTNTPSFTVTSTVTGTATRTPSATVTPTPTNLPNQVNIGPGIGYFPPMITINAGDTVNWVWKSGPHSTTSGSCPGGICAPDGNWDSGAPNLPPRTFSHTFLSTGTFTYYCRFHLSMMQGTVTVNP